MTEAGAEVLTHIQRIEASLAECEEALAALKGIAGGRVSVGITSTAKYFAPSALAGIAEEHPQVDLRLRVGNRDDIVARLKSIEPDLAITGRPPKAIEVDSAAFGGDPIVIIAPTDHTLAQRRNLLL